MVSQLKQSIKAVGFDVDGTLYKSSLEFSEWIGNQLLDEVVKGTGLSRGEAKKKFDDLRAELGSTTLSLCRLGLDGEQIFQDLFDRAPLAEFVKIDLELNRWLEKLALKYKLFIISNGTERQIVRKLKYLGINLDLFKPMIACYDHEGWTKPNPEAFLSVLDELKLKPEEVLFVGDREATDIEGAKAVGMKTMMVYSKSDLADVSMSSMLEGLRWLVE